MKCQNHLTELSICGQPAIVTIRDTRTKEKARVCHACFSKFQRRNEDDMENFELEWIVTDSSSSTTTASVVTQKGN